MAERKPNEIKFVAWFMAVKGVIKFANDDTTYKLGDAVIKASNFEKFPLFKGDKVEVGINEGVVTFLRKQKSEQPKEQLNSKPSSQTEVEKEDVPSNSTTVPTDSTPVKVEEKQEEPKLTGEIKELTVYAVSGDKRVVKFLEIKEQGWFDVSDELKQLDYPTIGLVAKSKLKVKIVGKEIVSIEKLATEATQPRQDAPVEAKEVKGESTPVQATPPPVQAPKKEWKPASSYDSAEKQISIEAQASVNSACDVVGRVAASISPAPTASIINNMIRSVAEANYSLIQELKKK
jgi:hypothetical protein